MYIYQSSSQLARNLPYVWNNILLKKLFAHIQQAPATFIIRVQHENRLVDVWNSQGHRFERTTVGALMTDSPTRLKLETTFTHARKTRTVRVALGWFAVYLPDEPDPLWLLTIHDPELDRDIGLLTNRPIQTAAELGKRLLAV